MAKYRELARDFIYPEQSGQSAVPENTGTGDQKGNDGIENHTASAPAPARAPAVSIWPVAVDGTVGTGVLSGGANVTGGGTGTNKENAPVTPPSTDVQMAENLLNKAMGYLNQYESRNPFAYDVNSDALYQQYAEQYIRQGQMAMMDAMGQAAAMTGGYGNSYAQTAGQQAYLAYLQQLNSVVPELHGMAEDRYDRDGQELLDMYDLYSGLYAATAGNEPNYTVLDYDNQVKWINAFKEAGSVEEIDHITDRMVQAGVDPQVAASWHDYYAGRLNVYG